MNRFDFSQLGGFPLTQNVLDHMQSGYKDACESLASVFVFNDAPIALSGITQLDAGGGDVAVSDGYFFHAGRLCRFVGSIFSEPGSGEEPFIVINDNAAMLPFNNGSTPTVKYDDVGVIEIRDSGDVEDSDKFKLSSLLPVRLSLAMATMPEVTMPFAEPTYLGDYTADSSSPIKYRKNYHSKTVIIKGITQSSSPSSVIIDSPIFILPEGMRPEEEQLFVVWSTTNTDHAVVRIKSNGEVSLAGDLIGVSTAGVSCNVRFDIE